MITQNIVDPEMIKINNEVVKAKMKKRLKTEAPGPGHYETSRKSPFGANGEKLEDLVASETKLKNSQSKGLLNKLGLPENFTGQKAAAFGGSSPRFKPTDLKSKELGSQDMNKPVYDL